jgi:hypothetical protein
MTTFDSGLDCVYYSANLELHRGGLPIAIFSADMDRTNHLRRVFRNLIANPVVSIPFGLGAATCVVALISGQFFGFLGFLGISGMLLGTGMAATRLLISAEDLGRVAYEELLDERDISQSEYLSDLGQRLSADGDTRTEEFLTALRHCFDRMQENDNLSNSAPAEFLPEIRANVDALYETCLGSLERTLVFANAARQMATPEARQELLHSREKLIDEIRSSIHCLGRTLDQLQTSALRQDDHSDLVEIRSELDQGLRVARQVEERMSQIEAGLDTRDRQ